MGTTTHADGRSALGQLAARDVGVAHEAVTLAEQVDRLRAEPGGQPLARLVVLLVPERKDDPAARVELADATCACGEDVYT
jgi:phosphopantetheine adenylyltransferase